MSQRIELGGGTVVRILSATGAGTLLELELQPGAGAGAHKHTREDETIAVVSGTLLVHDGERRILRAGEAIFLARGVRHSFANEGDEPVRAHISCTPGGLERFFREVATATEEEALAAAERAGLVLG